MLCVIALCIYFTSSILHGFLHLCLQLVCFDLKPEDETCVAYPSVSLRFMRMSLCAARSVGSQC